MGVPPPIHTRAYPTFHLNGTKLLKGSEALRISVDPTHSWVACTTRGWVSVFFAARSLGRIPHLVPFSWGGTRPDSLCCVYYPRLGIRLLRSTLPGPYTSSCTILLGRHKARLALRRANNAGSSALLMEAGTAVAPKVICNDALRGCKYCTSKILSSTNSRSCAAPYWLLVPWRLVLARRLVFSFGTRADAGSSMHTMRFLGLFLVQILRVLSPYDTAQ